MAVEVQVECISCHDYVAKKNAVRFKDGTFMCDYCYECYQESLADSPAFNDDGEMYEDEND